MDGQAIISISAAVVALTQLAKWAGTRDGYGPAIVLLLSTLGVVMWGYSEGTYERAKTFEYFTGWVAVSTSSAGIFGFTRATGENLTRFTSKEEQK